ncbi:MAG: aspartate/glutamate racemase family protein [Planctomycetota bacterium]|nr:aspartate/glutamate racemase family protein [Planctomycetota bacterium]
MKCIGLIGGMSWKSSAEYYTHINTLVADRLGGLHSARVILFSLEFDEIGRAQREDRWNDMAAMLTEAGKALKHAGADFLLICTNTMHKVADEVAEGAALPLLHIADVTGEAIRRAGLKTVGLLGTRFVMDEGFYRERLRNRFGLNVITPNDEDADFVHNIIFDDLCQGRFEPDARKRCVEIIGRLAKQGAEGIILGCTELPLLIRPCDVNVPLFNTTILHATAAVDMAMSEVKEK